MILTPEQQAAWRKARDEWLARRPPRPPQQPIHDTDEDWARDDQSDIDYDTAHEEPRWSDLPW